MGESIKAVLALIVLATLLTSTLGWLTRGIGGVLESQYWLRMSTLILVPATALLVWADFRKDKAPDFLRRFGRPFERDGLSFLPAPVLRDDVFVWVVLFQNRYERACEAVISLRAAVGTLGVQRPQIQEVHATIRCAGAAFGYVEVPAELPLKYQGKKIAFEVAAATRYPQGRGKLLRYREGARVGKKQKSGGDLALMVAAGAAGHLHYTRAARLQVVLPQHDSNLKPTGEANQQICWRPGAEVQDVAHLLPPEVLG